jgi:hypothetical protein
MGKKIMEKHKYNGIQINSTSTGIIYIKVGGDI